MPEYFVSNSVILLVKGDITEQDTEVIVNAANSSLMGGGGVDGAIHRRGGPKILEECLKIRGNEWPDGLPAGKAVITSGGNLKSKFVIHAVGPVWSGGLENETNLLRDAYRNSMYLASSKLLKSISFPSISTGAYRFPIEKASRIAIDTVKGFLERESTLKEVRFVLFSNNDFKLYENVAREILSK